MGEETPTTDGGGPTPPSSHPSVGKCLTTAGNLFHSPPHKLLPGEPLGVTWTQGGQGGRRCCPELNLILVKITKTFFCPGKGCGGVSGKKKQST